MKPEINLRWYNDLGDRWYGAYDDPVALLRAQSETLVPWIVSTLEKEKGLNKARILDLGCGAGLISNAIASHGYPVVGVDLSADALDVAKRHDQTGLVSYEVMDARKLQLPDETFDVALAMDVLERVEDPELLVSEAARTLRPGGLFFFHTFNRTWRSYFVVLKGLEWFVKNTPPHLHLYRMFIPPVEMKRHLTSAGLELKTLVGIRPAFTREVVRSFLLHRTVHENLRFTFTGSLATGYVGVARKIG